MNVPSAYMLKLCSAPEAISHHIVGRLRTRRTTATNGKWLAAVRASAAPRFGSRMNGAAMASNRPGTPATKNAPRQP